MPDFPHQIGPVRGITEPGDQQQAGRFLLTTRGASAYWDPPAATNPPLNRVPIDQIGGSDSGRAAQRMVFFGRTATSTAFSTFGIGAQGLTTTEEKNRRRVPFPGTDRTSEREDDIQGGVAMGPGNEWFERLVVVPSRIDLGNVLSTQTRDLELMNTFRAPKVALDWQAFNNNTNGGITITNLPGLPTTIPLFDSIILEVSISTQGPPSISGSLDFTFLAPVDPTVVQVPVTGNRITIFQYRPQAGIEETLEFKTDIMRNNDGTEQRVRVREAPRQLINFNVRTDDEVTRDKINAVLFDWQARVFGVPIWWEAKPLDADIAPATFNISVDTADADYRVGGLVMLFSDEGPGQFEVLEIDSIDPTFLTTSTPIANAFLAADTIVMPTRTAFTRPQTAQRRFAIGPTDFRMEFNVLDNVDLADIGTFNTYQGQGQTVAKPLLDGFNFMPGSTIAEGNRRRVVRLDVESGPPIQYSPWAKSKPNYSFGFEATSQAELWEWRQLMHYLRGSQLSFYVPTGRTDFKVITDIGDGAGFFDVENFGFSLFVGAVVPRGDLKIRRKDGTSSQHIIVGSSEQSPTVDRISVSPTISPALPVADIERIEFVTLGRIDGDSVTIQHRRVGEARLDFKTIGVPA